MFDLNYLVEIIKPIKTHNVVDVTVEYVSVSTDTRLIAKNDIFIALSGKKYDGNNFIQQAVDNGAACVISNRDVQGIRVPMLIVKDTLVALTKLAKARRVQSLVNVCAVTGSYGKTTTKDMLVHILDGCLHTRATENNIIGVSKTLLSLENQHEEAVLEFGTNHFGEITSLSKIALPNIVVITAIAECIQSF